MDALALLCTLHADGPSTLKALRARGHSTITEFATLDGDRIADELSIEPAAARRLLREAKILRERIGLGDLEAEEAPPVTHREVSPPPMVPIAETEGQAQETVLDEGDRELVARVASSPEPVASIIADAFVESDSKELDRVEPVQVEPVQVEHAAQVEFGARVEPEVESGQELESVEPGTAGELGVGSLPGLDEAMIVDLREAGVTTLAELGGAESLFLTRNLGVTFAQARRLRFLARRAAEARPDASVSQVSVRHEVAVERRAPELVLEEPAPDTPVPGSVAGRNEEAVEEALEEAVEKPIEEPQGVKIDPSEIEARPRFGEQFARAAAQGKLHRDTSSPGRTVLGWNFEIPRPEEESLPLPSLSPGPAVPEEGAAVDTEGEAAGPFA